MKNQRHSKGFSLIELMVAITAGLVVIGAAVVFTISTAQSSSANIHSTKVMQDLRSSLNLIEREIRRSGFDETAIKYSSACSDPTDPTKCPVSQFNSLVIASPTCIVVSYDNAKIPATSGTLGAGKYHGFRLVQNTNGVGVIQASLAKATAPSCTSPATDSDWADVTNPDVTNISNLDFSQPPAVGGCTLTNNGIWVAVQDVLVQISGTWTDPASHLVTTRSVEESVRARNDLVSLTKPSICP